MTKKLVRLIVSFSIVFLAWLIVSKPNMPLNENLPTAYALYAKETLMADTLLEDDLFECLAVPVEYLPEAEIEMEVQGKMLKYPLEKGEILLAKDLKGIKQEARVHVTLQTDTPSVRRGDKVAVMATYGDQTLTLLDNLKVDNIAEDEYSNQKLIVVVAKEDEAQALNILKPKATLTVLPSSGGLKAADNPLLAAKNLLQEKTLQKRRIEVIEGGDITWYEID